MNLINGKYIKNIGVYHGFDKNETETMFFLKKTFSSFLIYKLYSIQN